MKFSSAEAVIASHFQIKAEVTSLGELRDENTRSEKVNVYAEGKSWDVYPWGANNLLPQEMIELLRSNSDMGNLLNTRADFLFGAGIGLFKKRVDGTDLVLEPVWNTNIYDAMLKHGIEELVDTAILNMVQLNNAFLNVSNYSDGTKSFSCLDATTVRAVRVKENIGKIKQYVLSGRWDSTNGSSKYAKVYPAFDYTKPDSLPESILQLRPKQPGQFYYGYAIWWALKTWIKVSNKIAPYHFESLETEGNLGNIVRIARRYFDDVLATNPTKDDGTPYTYEELYDAFVKMMDDFAFGQGKRINVFDVCGYDAQNGKLVEYIKIDPVKKQMTGSEYSETYLNAVRAMTNGGQVLGGLSNISDGKMNSGGGTEIRISAEYQQFYRTPRERRLILEFLNRVVRPYFQKMKIIDSDTVFEFKNILLQTLDKNKAGVSQVNGSAQ